MHQCCWWGSKNTTNLFPFCIRLYFCRESVCLVNVQLCYRHCTFPAGMRRGPPLFFLCIAQKAYLNLTLQGVVYSRGPLSYVQLCYRHCTFPSGKRPGPAVERWQQLEVPPPRTRLGGGGGRGVERMDEAHRDRFVFNKVLVCSSKGVL